MDCILLPCNPFKVYRKTRLITYHNYDAYKYSGVIEIVDIFNFLCIMTLIGVALFCGAYSVYNKGYDHKAVMFIPNEYTFNQTIPITDSVCQTRYCYPAYIAETQYQCTISTKQNHLTPDYDTVYYTNQDCVFDNGDRFLKAPVKQKFQNSVSVIIALIAYFLLMMITSLSVCMYCKPRSNELRPLLT